MGFCHTLAVTKSGYMLEHPVFIPRYRTFVIGALDTAAMCGDNPMGGDNQQGRPRRSLTPDYVAGFIDGEGCLSVSIHPHPTIRYGRRWLIAPCFQAYQHRDNVEILELLRRFFGCGRILPKGPNSSVMTYSVYRRDDLEAVIIPFFDRYPLLSRRNEDFLKFREIVSSDARRGASKGRRLSPDRGPGFLHEPAG